MEDKATLCGHKLVVFSFGDISCVKPELTWKDLEIFKEHGLEIHRGKQVTSELIEKSTEVALYLYKLYYGFEPRTLQDLCAKSIMFSDMPLLNALPKPLRRVCGRYLYNELSVCVIRWDLPRILHCHKNWKII